MDKNFKEIMDISKYFKELKSDENALIEALNQLSEEHLERIKDYLDTTSKEKINKIRLDVLGHIIENGSITREVIEQIKTNVNALYKTDILHSWKSYFSLFYIFFYCDKRTEIKKQLKELSGQLRNDLRLSEFSASKEVDFDGVQNFGNDQAWIAIYNKNQQNQSSSLQLFVSFSYPYVSYGLYEFHNPKKFLTKEKVGIKKLSYEGILDHLKQSREKIVKDSNPVTVWKLSPGVGAELWSEMKRKNIASISWGDRNYTGLQTKYQVNKLAPEYFDKHPRSAGIICQLNKAKEGDLIYAFKGRKEVIGKGVIRSVSQYSQKPLIDGTDHHNYLEVAWDEAFVGGLKLNKMMPMDAFANISERRPELEEITKSTFEEVSQSSESIRDDDGSSSIQLNQILYGPPGTGKTYSTVDHALRIIKPDLYSDEDREKNLEEYSRYLENGQIIFTTFHQSYTYEDFIEGIKVSSSNNQLTYPVEPGIFKSLCIEAEEKPDQKFIIIIDEINRGNISKIFGELITLIEPDKRKGADEEISVKLPYSKEAFSIPTNVFILGTMNTADASIAKLDAALRRRFDFIEVMPNPKLLTDTKTEQGNAINVEGIDLQEMLSAMNERIELLYDRDHTIGHYFFMSLNNTSDISELAQVFEKNIIPLLQEYFFDDWSKIHTVLDCLKSSSAQETHFITKKYVNQKGLEELMGQSWELSSGVFNSIWKLNTNALNDPHAYRTIYTSEPKERGSEDSESNAVS